jgi:hypothetical protein
LVGGTDCLQLVCQRQVTLRAVETRHAETTTSPNVRHCAMIPSRCDSSSHVAVRAAPEGISSMRMSQNASRA